MDKCRICNHSFYFEELDRQICKTCEYELKKLTESYSKGAYNYFKQFDLKNSPGYIKMQLHSYFDFFRVGKISEKERFDEYYQKREEVFNQRKNEDCFESRVRFIPNVGFDLSYDSLCEYTTARIIKWNVSIKDCYKKGGLQIVYYSNIMSVVVLKGEGTKIKSGYIRYNKEKHENLSIQQIGKLLKLITTYNPLISGKNIINQIGNNYCEKSFIDMKKFQNLHDPKVIELKNRIDKYWKNEKFYTDKEIKAILAEEERRRYWAEYYAGQREINRLARTQKYDLRPSGISGGLCTPK